MRIVLCMVNLSLRPLWRDETSVITTCMDFCRQVLKSGIQIFRAADPDLIHVFHRVNCDRTLDKSQFEMCQGTRYSTYGAAHVLVRTLLENPNILAYKRANPWHSMFLYVKYFFIVVCLSKLMSQSLVIVKWISYYFCACWLISSVLLIMYSTI